jgi:signal transduction histidine kinase
VFGVTKHKSATYRGHRDLRWWPLLLLLLTMVLLPTACLLWMMSRAIDNERLAVRQAVADVCRGHLIRLQKAWDEHWRSKQVELCRVAAGKLPQERFAGVVFKHLADSAVCRDGSGRLVYPTATLPSADADCPADSPEWARARELEFSPAKDHGEQTQTLLDAAKAYLALAKDTGDANLAARALLAQARCLAKAGHNEEAIDVLTGPLADKRFERAVDEAGRLIVADAELRALELFAALRRPQRRDEINRVCQRLNLRLSSYDDPLLRSSQRLFLMRSLSGPKSSYGGISDLPSHFAEEIAAMVLELGTPLARESVLQPTKRSGIWQFTSADERVVALFCEHTIYRDFQTLAAQQCLPSGVDIALQRPELAGDMSGFLHVLPAGDRLPGWQLGLTWNDEKVVNAAVQGKIAAYMLTGLLAVAITAGLALWIALRFLRQMRLTRLKNDLVATVSHELKTPLASIRLLVDTLLATGTEEVVGTTSANSNIPSTTTSSVPLVPPVREYLELIAKENARLSRLIDNFLTFSRMERNKQAFSLAPVEPVTIVASAIDAVHERFEQSHCRFEYEIQPDLPPIMADADAMTTALVNLLDNAWKYTDDDKHIVLRASASAEGVCFAVADNGIGLSRSACKKVFQRFYQVDRELSRTRGGCGLGLSIVEFIVHAHAGRVTVESQPGRGSTFTVILPKACSCQPC